MLLRRFIAHVKEQNWFAVGLDVVVVIVGIFLGMQVADWNEQRKIENQLEIYNERLIEDLKADHAAVIVLRDYYLTVSRYAMLVIDDLMKNPDEFDDNFILNVYQATQDFNLDLNFFTLNEMTANGMITEFKDIKYRRMISQYYASNSTVRSLDQEDTEYRINIRKRLSTEVQNLIKDACGDQIVISDDTALLATLPFPCSIELTDKQLKRELTSLASYQTLEEDLNFRLAQIDVKITDLNNVINQLESIISYAGQSAQP